MDRRIQEEESHEDDVVKEVLQSDKNAEWSPKGTYLICIKHEKVEFLGGK